MVRHIGKESNRLEEVEEGTVADLDEVQIQYVDEAAEWASVVEVLREIGVSELVRLTGMPHPKDRRRLMEIAAGRSAN